MSRDDRFKARDKRTHKMTKDGLVEVNQATGEESRLSQRGQDFQLRQKLQPDSAARPAPENGGRRTYPQAPNMTRDSRQDDFSSPTGNPQPGAPEGGAEHAARQSPVDSSFTARDSGTGQGRRQHGTQYQRQFQAKAETPIGSPAPERPVHRTGTPAETYPDSSSGTALPDSAVHGGAGFGPPEEPPFAKSTGRTHRAVPPDHDAKLPEAGGSRLRFDQPGASASAGKKTDQRNTKYTRKFAAPETEKSGAAADGPASGDPGSGTKTGTAPRLQFAKDEAPLSQNGSPSRKLEKSRLKAERSAEKLADAKKELPTRRRATIEKVTDAKSGKARRKLRFEHEVKSRRAHLKGPLPLRPVKAGANAAAGYAHKKIYQVEKENVGVEAGHKAELMAEGLGRTAYRMHKTAPYRRVAKLERLNRKHSINHMYRKALHENPKLKSNMVSRFVQKQKIKRQYAKAAREAKRGAKNAKKAGDLTVRAAKAVTGFISRHPVGVGIALLLLMLIFVIMTMFGSCSNMAAGALSSVVASSYVAEDKDIDDAELAYSEWETDLLLEIQNAESSHPGFDEYRYHVSDVSHDPYELMAYLTARYQDFTFAEIQAELRSVFDEQYQLSFDEEVEIRTRTVTRTDPDTGEEYEEEEEYEWYVLNINLTSRPFSDIVIPRLDSDQREHFEVLMQTKGNRQYALNPFPFNWLPYVSSHYGYRVHPVSGEKDYHKGIDIAVPAGTEILATHDGRVTFAGSGGDYGLVAVVENDKGLVTKYAHCSALLVSAGQEVQKGDPIAQVGSTGNSTGPHLHFEVIQNGQYLNPLFFSETGDDGSGRIPPGSPGGIDFPEYPGTPLGDGSYAALIAEAELHLGKKYVFGASGPANFDCSGYVSWVLDKSGVKPMSRTNAQGLYNMCTPVSAANAQPGDLIFFHSTYSSPNPVSHIGIYVGNNTMLHCGDPISYTRIDTSYWQSHFYAFARIN